MQIFLRFIIFIKNLPKRTQSFLEVYIGGRESSDLIFAICLEKSKNLRGSYHRCFAISSCDSYWIL